MLGRTTRPLARRALLIDDELASEERGGTYHVYCLTKQSVAAHRAPVLSAAVA